MPLDNKERIEVLKGISGMQAGTSSPGGLVNFVVKRPTDEPLRLAWLQWQSEASLLASVDLSQRFGEQNAFGLRLNAAYEQLRPDVNDADGQRALLALAGDWRLSRDTPARSRVREQPPQPAQRAGLQPARRPRAAAGWTRAST